MDLERMMRLLEDERLLDWIQEQGGLIAWHRRKLPCTVWLSDNPVNPETVREWIRREMREWEKKEGLCNES